MYIKICGITKPEQANAIACQGVNGLGFICVPSSPRYVDPEQVKVLSLALKCEDNHCDRIGVFLNASIEEISRYAPQLTGIQLHGGESPTFCRVIKSQFPDLKLIKAFRIGDTQALAQVHAYTDEVDVVLLDAYDPQIAGGTGKTIDWSILQDFHPSCDWWLAGGLSPANIEAALSQLQPHGIDVSSGVERSPGDKDLAKVKQLLSFCKKSIDIYAIQ